jgi:hypothetical protein
MRLLAALSVALSLAGSADASELILTLTVGGKPAADAVVMVRPDAGARQGARLAGPFELKLYGKDEAHGVRLARAGVVGVGCNIHDDMNGFIRVVDTPYVARSAAGRLAQVRELAAGPATVTVWHPHLTGLEAVRRVTAPGIGALRLPLAIEVRSARPKRDGY